MKHKVFFRSHFAHLPDYPGNRRAGQLRETADSERDHPGRRENQQAASGSESLFRRGDVRKQTRVSRPGAPASSGSSAASHPEPTHSLQLGFRERKVGLEEVEGGKEEVGKEERVNRGERRAPGAGGGWARGARGRRS